MRYNLEQLPTNIAVLRIAYQEGDETLHQQIKSNSGSDDHAHSTQFLNLSTSATLGIDYEDDSYQNMVWQHRVSIVTADAMCAPLMGWCSLRKVSLQPGVQCIPMQRLSPG